jgi:hypothetical protein
MDKTNGKIANVEIEMAQDELKRVIPYLIKENRMKAGVMWEKYCALLEAGFDKRQAMQIICERPLIEE